MFIAYQLYETTKYVVISRDEQDTDPFPVLHFRVRDMKMITLESQNNIVL